MTRPNGNRVPIAVRRTATSIKSATQAWNLNGEETVNIIVESPFPQQYEIGDKITVFGRDYTLNRTPVMKKTGMHDFQYTLTFEGAQYDLLRVLYNLNIETTGNTLQDVQAETLTGTLQKFMQVLIANANRVFPGKWSLGACPETEYKTIGFDGENCLAVLQTLCNEFSNDGKNEYVEFEIIYAETDDELDSLCEELSNKYFGGRTDYTVDYDFYSMRVNATFNEIKAVSEDDAVGYIHFYGADGICYDLYKALYFEDDDYLTDIFVEDYSEEHLTSNFTEYADTYFADCEYDIFNFGSEELLIIKGASKKQIFEASQDNNFVMNLFDYPLIRHYNDIVIYGENGSAAQTYAEENSIEFVGSGSEYQLGDVNLDGIVNVTDATEILKYNVELVAFTDEQKALADFDGNGIINVSDVSELQRAIVNS